MSLYPGCYQNPQNQAYTPNKEILEANPLETIENADIDAINNAKDALMKDVTDFSTKMYQQAGAAQGAQDAGANQSSGIPSKP